MQNQNYLPTHQKTNEQWKNTSIDTVKQAQSSKKISDCSDVELAQQMLLIYFTIGLRLSNYPTKEMESFLFKYIRDNFGHRHIAELYLAFDLAVKERLDIDDVKCYENFSIEYLQRIMNSYRRYVNQVIKEAKQEPVKEIEYKLTADDKQKEIDEWKQKDRIQFDLIPIYLFNWMIELGHIEKDIEPYIEKACSIHKTNLLLKAEKGDLSDRRRYKEFMNMYDTGEIIGFEKVQILTLIKRIKVFDYLKANNNKIL